jgi:hypothetical protein
MNKLFALLCIAGTAFALSACDTTGNGNVETAVPYTTERTASGEPAQVAPAEERTFRAQQSK